MDTTFSDDEKRFVLGEMIKVSNIDVLTLVDFIKAHNIEPRWMSMQLPGGRNMNQCLGAVDNMFQVKFPPPNLTSFKRKSLSDLVDHPSKRQAIMPPIEPPLAPVRIIQPRPAPPNGYSPAAPPSSGPTVTATGKKRGRPSKADKEAQAQARAGYSRPTEYAPITPAPLAPIALQPQREYVSSPGYEVASSSADQNAKKRARTNTVDSPQQASISYPLASPASATGTPRALPEPLEHIDRSNLSPRDRGSAPLDPRSPPLPYMQHHDTAQTHNHFHPRTQPPVPIQPSPRPSQPYDQYRGPDPIFPDRDRSRNVQEGLPRDSSAPPLANRG